MDVVEVAEADVEASQARTPPLWVEVDAGNRFAHELPLRQPPGRRDTHCAIFSACPLS